MSCAVNLQTEGKKEASKEVGEEKRKRSFTCRERKRLKINVSKKRKSKTTAGSYKARAVVTGPVQVGKIDLNPKAAVLLSEEKKEAVKALLLLLKRPSLRNLF
jgi:translation initiation factor IF-2